MVEFVSYSGSFPNLCSGKLVLKIDGKEVSFGPHKNKFWFTGGNCGFDSRGCENITHDEWKLWEDEIPPQYTKYAQEMIDVFNANVPFGCCGGCI